MTCQECGCDEFDQGDLGWYCVNCGAPAPDRDIEYTPEPEDELAHLEMLGREMNIAI